MDTTYLREDERDLVRQLDYYDDIGSDSGAFTDVKNMRMLVERLIEERKKNAELMVVSDEMCAFLECHVDPFDVPYDMEEWIGKVKEWRRVVGGESAAE